ncbi:bifunctional UDP-N-acetylglucosamine pyrophosphorylase/glucosamine-1-phosphate N-acetyltransferase [Methanohalophilus levihalophilus]|uniref:bifunctional sugar-1-phosphate nucleotidylyltransferase/acetyltransferase n=1 Tax=Methanohalophilus levihalophilus TaxID=1431282 RepID=UPI001AEB76BA|nr:bifunctional sugar-1-phosphate nucleotidylyltransferase/acetyltransferase [Methanohalophilus levihalophilus]MBP2031077.1 bifunctional UDP-N-acetylglucosamine pyrophosphorylase/glucosamine-1-phosphate N-acetyltransferase [Methanohalophilus levihalophilus]
MKAVILAAGQGTRMRPLTDDTPKVMLTIANQPILEHIIIAASEAGIKDFLIVTGYREDLIKSHFGNGSDLGVNIDYTHQNEQRGTAHAIGCAEGYVDGRFIVLNGDMLVSSSHMRKLVGRKNEEAVLTVKKVENPKDFGVISTSGDKVTRILEKPEEPPTDLANAGIYIFNSDIFSYIKQTKESVRGELEITDTLQKLIDEGKDVGYELLEDEWLDIGRPWDLLDANAFLLSGLKGSIEGTVESFATLQGEVVVGEGTTVRNGAYIIGPVVIGKNCDIGPNCFIRPGTAIGDDVHVGNAVEVKNSIIMDGTKIGHLTYIGDSVIGRNCNFGAGTKVANLRHDGKNIKLMIKGKLVDSGRRKLGVIMGDEVHTGINTSINVGCVMKKGTGTKPGESIH